MNISKPSLNLKEQANEGIILIQKKSINIMKLEDKPKKFVIPDKKVKNVKESMVKGKIKELGSR